MAHPTEPQLPHDPPEPPTGSPARRQRPRRSRAAPSRRSTGSCCARPAGSRSTRRSGWWSWSRRWPLALAPGIILVIFPDLTDSVAGFSYGGVFLTNLASTATFFFPVPGLTAAAQTLIATEGEESDLPVARRRRRWRRHGSRRDYGLLRRLPGRGAGARAGVRRTGAAAAHIERVVGGVNWLMKRWGMATLFVLSALPNPLFEVAGLTAGSVRMPFRRFLALRDGGQDPPWHPARVLRRERVRRDQATLSF